MNLVRAFRRYTLALGILSTTFGIAGCSHPSRPSLPVAAEETRRAEQPPAPDLISEPAAILSVQEALNELGYDAGKPDGIAGPSTHKAVARFQRDHNLVEDGRLTPVIAEDIKTHVDSLTIAVGDVMIFSDGASEISAVEHTIQWAVPDRGRSVVAVRPSTGSWPSAARTGLDWAITHALDLSHAGSSVEWSSTGVHSRFEIRTFPALSQREMEIVGPDQLCRRFELLSDETHRRYPGLACKDRKGVWFIADSRIALARPITEIGSRASVPNLRH
ncbi:MAG TPA: peptidoglycan-binding domain-containing protein [Rhizomicrobium sp.]|jgi:peptidoglycan hydrolase-like protein with peptidoglycan-binding domain|nr:peptidoglycan-binding domain-containing protein [Rhizomicrobium sp.]